ALLFDVFGTVVDWRSSVVRELKEVGRKYGFDEVSEEDWVAFANKWRDGYLTNTSVLKKSYNLQSDGPKDVDTMHRQILDDILSSPQWSKVGAALDNTARADLNMVWHRLDGWPDSSSGLQKLKQHVIIATLSNGNLRLLVDMAKHAQLPWDTVFSTALFDSYKPNPITYQSALTHLSLSQTPHKAAMVAAHLSDLRAAAKLGMKTVYVKREGEERLLVPEGVKSKSEQGEVDVVVSSFEELAEVLAREKGKGI
ncbi:haloacid dehalogenase, partial [Dendrothele bispora CBS 962.96]